MDSSSRAPTPPTREDARHSEGNDWEAKEELVGGEKKKIGDSNPGLMAENHPS